MIDVFISHSTEDVALVSKLVDLLRSSLNLKAEQIRCTSLDGHRFPAGVNIDESLRTEVFESRAFIGVISATSLSSPYVLFELGARWGSNRSFVPLLAPGIGFQSLRGPLSNLNALACESSGQLHQLVSEIQSALEIEAEKPAVYQSKIEAMLQGEVQLANDDVAPNHSTGSSGTIGRSPESGSEEYPDAETIIKQHCEESWPEDYRMRSYCIRQQRDALALLKRGRPADIPEDVFMRIRDKSASEWPRDLQMRQYSEKQQIDAYRELKRDA